MSIHNRKFRLRCIAFTAAVCLLGGCTTLRSEHRTSISKTSLDSFLPGRTESVNEWVAFDLCKPRTYGNIHRVSWSDPIQDLLDLEGSP